MHSYEQQYNILYTCTAGRKRGGEELVREHVLSYVITGEIHFFHNGGAFTFGPGSIGLLRKNLLLKTSKIPTPGGEPFQSLNLFLDQASLRGFSAQSNILANNMYTGESLIDMSDDRFLKGFFDSLLPYFRSNFPLTAGMAKLKTEEAIELVLRNNSGLKNLLFNYHEPFKIDLEAFMGQNYIYNITIAEFARLSGRSLATFKRDFKKVFDDTPERWIRQRRLEKAHFLIEKQRQAPASVYLDVGFESLSNFSSAFKKHFGYNPSELRR